MMKCPNCGERSCYCTWDDMQRAIAIKRRKAAEFRRTINRPSVVERDEAERKSRK